MSKNKTLLGIALLTLCIGVQVWMIAILLTAKLALPQVVYFIVFVLGTLLMAFILRCYQPAVSAGFVITEFVLTTLLICAAVQTVFYDYRITLAQRALWAVAAVCVLNKFTWPWVSATVQAVYRLFVDPTNRAILRKALQLFGLVLIFMVIDVPSPQRLSAHMYLGEQFHHHDIFVLAPGWAAYKGHIMDVDHISQYGVGMPIVFASICRLMGGFSHAHVLQIIIWGSLIYYTAFFIFTGLWLRSWLLAVLVLLLGMRVQMFHPGVYPFVLTYPSATVMRYFFDIFFFLLLWRHLKSLRPAWLLAAGVLSGWACFYTDSTGLFLMGTFYFYLLLLFVRQETRLRSGILFLALILPVATAGALFYGAAGKAVLTHQFWSNWLETTDYFLSGIGTYPMNESFKYHMFWPGLIGFVIPLVYVWTILWVGSLWLIPRFHSGSTLSKVEGLTGQCSRWQILAIAWSAYGLGLDHYYIARSLLTSYYVNGLALMLVAGYWIKMLVTRLSVKQRYPILFSGLALALYALVTNHMFMAYPNRLNLSHDPLVDPLVAQPLPADLSSYFFHISRKDPEELKMPTNSLEETNEQLFTERDVPSEDVLTWYYHKDFDFSRDAQMISSLTKPNERVALISDFEVKILIQADKAPFFYYFPLISSRPKHMRTLPLNFLHTSTNKFNQTAINQLAKDKPQYVFLERIFLEGQPPPAYLAKAENMWFIVQYVLDHYRLDRTGQYLAVMKRNK